MCIGPFSGLVRFSPVPGSVYRSHQIFEKLWSDIHSDNATAIEVRFSLSLLLFVHSYRWSDPVAIYI